MITNIELIPSKIKLKKPFIISLGPFYYAENVIVKIHTSEGIIGTGECSPFPSIHGETAETAMYVGNLLATILKGKDEHHIAECIQAMDSVIFGNRCIKSAFDIALYDIASQLAGMPLYKFLGGENNRTLFTDYTVSIGDPATMAEDALKIKNDGFQVIKVKLGGDKATDLARIRSIREKIGQEIPLRVDANQGWKTDQAIEILQSIEPYNIQFCEEPILRNQYKELAKVRKESPVKIMADESCCTLTDIQNLLDSNSCDMFNIKLGKCGGIYKALQLLKKAEEFNIPVQLSGFLESRLGFTATAHLALTSKLVQYCDFDTPLMFSEDPVGGGITYGDKWQIQFPEGNGLGASY